MRERDRREGPGEGGSAARARRPRDARRIAPTIPALVLAVASALGLAVAIVSPAAAEGFLGEGRCQHPACHGAGVPSPDTPPERMPPAWKSARSRWLGIDDRHSRAYLTLERPESRRIAAWMGIEATTSARCLDCHAPDAALAEPSRHRRRDGVSCEHCHGPAEAWIDAHVQESWSEQRGRYVERGFVDLDDHVVRAETCGRCHLKIDHEILAGGHPPLQLEVVAYAAVMRHWDDADELPPGSFSPDPTLWATGQLVALRDAARMVAERAGDADRQGLAGFHGFEGKDCYTCHHKLVEDAARQAVGHLRMVESLLAVVDRPARTSLASAWDELRAAIPRDRAGTVTAAEGLARRADEVLQARRSSALTRDQTRAVLRDLTGRGAELAPVPSFSHGPPRETRGPEDRRVARVAGVEYPWWESTGAANQTVLALLALCEPGFGPDRCAYGRRGSVFPRIADLSASVDWFAYDPARFQRELGAVRRALFP